MFYDLYLELCKEKNVTPTRAALEIGISKATPTTWKKRGLTPQGETLNKIASYFGVSTDYLLGNVSEPYFHLDNDRIKREINSYSDEEKTPTQEGKRVAELTPAFFRLQQGLEPYDITESDADFLVEVYKAHIKKNQ